MDQDEDGSLGNPQVMAVVSSSSEDATSLCSSSLPEPKRRKVNHVKDRKKDNEVLDVDSPQHKLIGCIFDKKFGDQYYEGKVDRHDCETNWYHVVYKDGDDEELSEGELSQLVKETLAEKKQKKRKTRQPSKKSKPAQSVETMVETTTEMTTSRYGRERKVVKYADSDNDEVFFDSDASSLERRERKKKKKLSTKGKDKALSKKMAKRKVSSDDDSFSAGSSSSSEEQLSNVYSSSEEEVSAPKKSIQNNTKGKKKSASGKKKMCDSFKPLNAPPYMKLSLDEIYEQKEFLDPCGMEATDDIIGGLVGDQIDKIGSLLRRALDHEDNLGSRVVPLRLGTACSGTDAPALALTLVQEQMELRGLGDLNFSHEMSCENEPFKQAYLARNFDSALYPDIVKLTDEEPRDVYGQIKPLPPFNFFVAGTSCKNFSMLRSTKRMDIEDKGCSGETFLAATEVLFKTKPPFVVFENVIGAPWAKMQEYITGRVKLSDCDSKKAIKDINGKDGDLTFVVDKRRRIIVDKVPAVYGVRCGAVVAGYLRSGSAKLRNVEWPTSKSKSCTLKDLIKKNNISKEDDTLVFETECTYCTHLVKVDTKEYGLPQTRQRTYMFVWRPDGDDVSDDLGKYWEAIVKHLKSPVRHSLEAFILQVDHDAIRVFREALRGPSGRQTCRRVLLEPDFWSSASADLPHNKVAREKLGLKGTARFITHWEGYGKRQIPPHYWLEYLKCNFQREMDMLDILHASATRDAESHDSSFSSFFWNVSQNVSKEKHRTACPGIAGCITPGGDFFLPHQGRPLLGCEKLLVQGIPYFRLALGNETEVQLGDLAGNAMSLTVVCATMLAAITCEQLRRETLKSSKSDMHDILSNNMRFEDSKKLVTWNGEIEGASEKLMGPSLQFSNAMCLFRELSSLAPEAVNSSIWCTCETSGSTSQTTEFLQCQLCRCSCCRKCIGATAGYYLESHDTEDVSIASEDHCSGTFLSKLRKLVPSSLCFNEEGINEVAGMNSDSFRVSGLSKYAFDLHRIKRERMKWLIFYYARENNGIGEAIAQFRISVGEIERKAVSSVTNTEREMGLTGELTSFLPARTEPLAFGPLEPCLTITVKHGSTEASPWRGRIKDETTSLLIEGGGSTDSPRVEVGLTDHAAEDLEVAVNQRNNKPWFIEAKKRGERRRWLYPDNWKVWPETISINAIPSSRCTETDLCGTYERARCRQTTNQSALWVRKADADKPALYIIIQPNTGRTGPDTAIVTSSISHNDLPAVLAVLPRDWQPCDALKPKRHIVDNVKQKGWKALVTTECRIPQSSINVSSTEDSLVSVSGLDATDVTMLGRGNDSSDNLVRLNVTEGQRAQQTVRVFNSICVAPILKYAAGNGLKYDLHAESPWVPLSQSKCDVPFGCCQKTIPKRPTEKWYFDDERETWERRSEPGASREYYLKLQEAPQAFELWLDKAEKLLKVKCFPEVVAHRASAQLIEGRDDDGRMKEEVSVCFRLSDVTQQSDPIITPFTVSNCDTEDPTVVPLSGGHKLYERQQKVVTKMLAIEHMKTKFEELEMSEYEMPGSAGLSLVAKATRNSVLRGGVIADAIGAGKTVISIALIIKGLKKARDSRKPPNKSGATLVVVPPALIDQWESEIAKFSDSLKVVQVYDWRSLEKITAQEIIEADVVVCPIDILESSGYMSCVIKAAGLAEKFPDVPKLPQYTGQIEQNNARGVWIPATSADPYAGGNNSNNQKRRNISAFYTYVYLTAVQALRKKRFSPGEKGVPLEYFEYERIIVDEIHESLCTTRVELENAKERDKANTKSGSLSSGFFREKNRRAGRELLGITRKNIRTRPLIFRRAIFGLTGTPLLDSSSRVVELANLMGCAYVISLSSHWRKLERESRRDIFLHNYLEPKQSREVRKNIFSKCQEYLRVACCRNKTGEEMEGIELVQHLRVVKMTEEEKSQYLRSQKGISSSKQSLAIKAEDFDQSAGHDISVFLRQNASFETRGRELVRICKDILQRQGDEHTKIIVFTDGRIGAGEAARSFLCAEDSGIGCTWLDNEDSVEVKNKKISWYQHGDATKEDRMRPRVLVLHFEHAAGLNLQTECHDLILFTPLYVGVGGSSGDPVSDTSTELQAIGRVYRAGQTSRTVNVYRIEVQGPNGEECLDGQLIRRNTDKETVEMATGGDAIEQ